LKIVLIGAWYGDTPSAEIARVVKKVHADMLLEKTKCDPTP
jgi:hypothetical protein